MVARRDQRTLNLAAFDPGLVSGAMALYLNAGTSEESWVVDDLPTMGADKQVVLNGTAIGDVLRMSDVNYAIVEHVHAMPKQGVSGVFKFGTAYGQILGVLQALRIPYELVPPQVWKKAMRLPGGPAKGEAARGRALELYPSLHEQLARKRDHNRAEALLIGRWWTENRGAL